MTVREPDVAHTAGAGRAARRRHPDLRGADLASVAFWLTLLLSLALPALVYHLEGWQGRWRVEDQTAVVSDGAGGALFCTVAAAPDGWWPLVRRRAVEAAAGIACAPIQLPESVSQAPPPTTTSVAMGRLTWRVVADEGCVSVRSGMLRRSVLASTCQAS